MFRRARWWMVGLAMAGLIWGAAWVRVDWFRMAQPLSAGEPARVQGQTVAVQTLLSRQRGLTAIAIAPVEPWPPADQLITLVVREGSRGDLILTESLPFRALLTGAFTFAPFDDSAGRRYRIEIRTQGAPLLLGRHPANVYVDGAFAPCDLSSPCFLETDPPPSNGDLVFRVDYNGPLGPALGSVAAGLTGGRGGLAGQPGAYALLVVGYGLALWGAAQVLFRRVRQMTTTSLAPQASQTASSAPGLSPARMTHPICKLIVQIPCLNEAETLPVTLAAIPRQIAGVERVEVLIIDDGSEDGTADVALAHGADHVVRHPARRGLAAAFETGVQTSLAAGADVILNTDGDNQYPGDQIPLLLAPLLAGRADLVVGDRKPGANPEFTWSKRLLQRLGSWVVAQAAGAPVPDATSGFRAYTRDAALRLYQFTRYTYTLETLIQAGKKGLRVAHVDIATNPVARPSRLMRSQWEYVKRSAATIVRLYAIYEPLRTFGLISLPFILVGLGLIGRFLFLYAMGFLAEGVARLVQSLLIGATSLIVGILILMFGLLADLIAANRRLTEEALYRLRRMELQQAREREPRN